MTPHELAIWRCDRCPHKETITGLRADCLVCLSDLLTAAIRDAEIAKLEWARDRMCPRCARRVPLHIGREAEFHEDYAVCYAIEIRPEIERLKAGKA